MKARVKTRLKTRLKNSRENSRQSQGETSCYSEDESIGVEDTVVATSGKNQTVSMSKEELAGLDAALSKNDAEIIQQNWGDQHSVDRWSHYWDC